MVPFSLGIKKVKYSPLPKLISNKVRKTTTKMEGSCPDWTSLPAEILSKIFHYPEIDVNVPYPYHLPDRNKAQCDLSEAALVCKAWRNPAQSSLYLHVRINSFLQLKKFHDVIRSNISFGTMVKAFRFHVNHLDNSDKAILLDIATNLLSNCLPNLEYLHQDDVYGSYALILNALLDSKLKYLKRIEISPYHQEIERYISCAFLMRDRLQEVYINNHRLCFWNRNTETKFQQLYDNLNQFNNLTKIIISRKTDDGIAVLEHVVESCRSLRDINLGLHSRNYHYDGVQLQDYIDFDIMSQYIPRYNIKTLTISLSMTPIDNCKVLLYIIKKFPNLENLELDANKKLKVTPYIIIQLLNYFEKIKQGCVYDLTTIQGDFYEAIGNFWNETSKPGKGNVKFVYNNSDEDKSESTNIITKDLVDGTCIHLERSLHFFNRQPHIEFIEKIGLFIDSLQFDFDNTFCGIDNFEDYCDTSNDFLIHIFKHCLNLRTLRIGNFILHECVNSKVDKIKRHSLDYLTLDSCYINPGALEQLSTVLSEIKEFDFDSEDFDTEENDYIRRINMPQTKIQRLVLGPIPDKYDIYLKLFVVTDQKYYYYQSESKTDSVESLKRRTKGIQIDENVYNAVDDERFMNFYVCCQTKPEIIFNCYHLSP